MIKLSVEKLGYQSVDSWADKLYGPPWAAFAIAPKEAEQFQAWVPG